MKHGVECDLSIVSSAANGGSVPQQQNSSFQLSPCSATAVDSSSIEGGAFTVVDLELLHHYTTSACLTFSTDPMVRNFWRVNVPQIGFTTPYILQGLLSISALHLAKFRPDRKEFYISEALLRHNAASRTVSQLIVNISAGNCVELFLFSTITNYFALAKPREPDSFLLARHGGLPDWLMLFRGVRAVMEAQTDVIRHSPVGPMFEAGLTMHEYWISHSYENEALRALETSIRKTVSDESENLDALMNAMDALKRSYAVVYEGRQMKSQGDDNDKVRGIFIWLFKVSDAYITLVSQGNSEALCILAYFCVLMRRLDYLWWMEGWGLHLIANIYSRLNHSYRFWIRWPIEEIGWVPEV